MKRAAVLLPGDLGVASGKGGRLGQELQEEFLSVLEMLVFLTLDHCAVHLSAVAFEHDPLMGRIAPLCPVTGNSCLEADPKIRGLLSLVELVQVCQSLAESGVRSIASLLDRLAVRGGNADRVVRRAPARIGHILDLQSLLGGPSDAHWGHLQGASGKAGWTVAPRMMSSHCLRCPTGGSGPALSSAAAGLLASQREHS